MMWNVENVQASIIEKQRKKGTYAIKLYKDIRDGQPFLGLFQSLNLVREISWFMLRIGLITLKSI